MVPILLSGLPSFPLGSSVMQVPGTNAVIDETHGSTDISWSNATTMSSGEVTYTVRLDSEVVDITTMTRVTLTNLTYNQQHNVSVEASNVCNKVSGSPLQGTVEVPAPGELYCYKFRYALYKSFLSC